MAPLKESSLTRYRWLYKDEFDNIPIHFDDRWRRGPRTKMTQEEIQARLADSYDRDFDLPDDDIPKHGSMNMKNLEKDNGI